VARSKRSERAEARRRHRLAMAEPGEAEALDGETAERASGATAGAKPAGRPGITAAFRGAYRQAHIREDLALLPSLLRHWSFWVPAVLMVATAVTVTAAPSNPIAIFAFQTMVLPPAMAAIFVTGFFAPRGAYLLGGLLGVLDVIVYTGFLAYAGTSGLGGEPIPDAAIRDQVLSAISIGPPSGVMFGALAAWYRRFLALSNPNRGRAQATKGKPKRSSQSGGRPLFGRR